MPSNPTQPGQSGCSPTPRDEPQPGSHWPLAPYTAPSGPTHQPSVLCSFQHPSLSSDPPASQPHIPALAGRRASPEARRPVPTSTATVQGQRASGCPSNLRVRPQSCPPARTPSPGSDPGFTWPLPVATDLCPCLPAPFGLEAFPKQRACAHLTDGTPEAGWRTQLVRSGASGPRHPIESGQSRVSLTVSP